MYVCACVRTHESAFSWCLKKSSMMHIFIHNRPKGSHDTADIKVVVGLQLVRYISSATPLWLAKRIGSSLSLLVGVDHDA